MKPIVRLLTSLGVVALSSAACVPSLRAEEPLNDAIVVEGVHFVVYEEGRKQFTVEGRRGHPSLRRLGFLQTALVPTFEVEDAVIERFDDQGMPADRLHLPFVSVDWSDKSIRDPRGRLVARPSQ